MSDHVIAGERLKEGLEQSAGDAGCRLTCMAQRDQRWASVMFDGGRHSLTVILAGIDAAGWLEQLSDRSVDVPGFMLADLQVGAVEEKGGQLLVELEALSIREA